MQMIMQMRADMVQREASGSKGFELCPDLAAELSQHRRRRNEGDTQSQEIAAQATPCVNHAGNFVSRQDWPVLDDRQMQADAQPRQALGASNCILRRRSAHHQARRTEDPVPVRLFHGFIDFGRDAEIIGRQDKLPQGATSRRSLRKRKNSTPSRRRRLIISGLRTISPTMEAIFGARK